MVDLLLMFWYEFFFKGEWYDYLFLDKVFFDFSGVWVLLRFFWMDFNGVFVVMKGGKMIGYVICKVIFYLGSNID